jgi:hypothetical protein
VNFTAQELKIKVLEYMCKSLNCRHFIASYAKMFYKNKYKEYFMFLLFSAFKSLWVKNDTGM